MGCFDVECAATRVAIHHGDPVYIIYWGSWKSILTKEEHWPRIRSTYEAINVVRQQANSPFSGDNDWDFMSEGIKGYRGIYNDYGWYETTLYGDEGGSRPDFPYDAVSDPICYLHLWVAKLLCEQQGVSFDNPDERFVIQAIAQSAHLARIQLFSADHLLGSQYYDIEEMEFQLEILNRTKAFLEQRLAEHFDAFDEYPDEEGDEF